MNYRYFLSISLLIVLSSCSSLHVGAGGVYGTGRNNGCPVEGGGSVVFGEVTKFFSPGNGLGFSVQMYGAGYSDCNDHDPLVFLSSLLLYRRFLVEDRLFYTFGGGFTTGSFTDPGASIAGGLTFYADKDLYLQFQQKYYHSIWESSNLIKPGPSYNSSSMLVIGLHF